MSARSATDAGTLPDGALRGTGPRIGRTLAGAARAGEPITDLRVLGARLAELAGGCRRRPNRPDPARRSRRGRILARGRPRRRGHRHRAGEQGAATAEAMARRRRACSPGTPRWCSSPRRATGRDAERMVMVALPAEQATAVAAASLSSALTVVFH